MTVAVMCYQQINKLKKHSVLVHLHDLISNYNSLNHFLSLHGLKSSISTSAEYHCLVLWENASFQEVFTWEISKDSDITLDINGKSSVLKCLWTMSLTS